MTESRTGKLVDARWERLQELFSKAVEMPQGERETFIARETADEPSMRDELMELLACDRGGSTGPLTHALGAAIDATSRDRRKALVGRVVGNYKLVSVLGHGGTGTVYLGERADRQYSAQVAVKIVDTGQVHGDLGLRFRAERQILASLNHPNIARLLDAGETTEGQPFLVMEYVHGEPLDRYCDRQQLDVRARLQLFVEICSAVQYAHQNLIVHRDLKPANILVTSEGMPKLLDFGIAKLLDAGDSASVLALTRMNDRLLTPEYASPEQILGRPVTTASDVYALGVVLYELMTGLRPYVVPASASQLELERSICVTDPVRPSGAVRRAMETGPLHGHSEISSVAAARGITAEKLHRRLLGDIDSIVMRALRKEPQHRYSSVEQLAADVRRYLTREPVIARQGNWIYYSQRFIRRHAFGVSAGAAFLAFIIAFAVTMSVQTQRIAQERDRAAQEGKRAETVSDFMIEIFSWSEPATHQGRAMTARELLDSAGTRIRGDLQQQPEVRARLLEAIGRAYRRQNEYERAITYLEDALRIRREMPDADGTKTANVLTELAIALRMSGDLVSADRTLQQALALTKQHSDNRSETYAKLLTNLGRGQLMAGNLPLARQYLEESLKLNRELFGSAHSEVANVLLELSGVFLWQDDKPAAEKAVRQAIDIFVSNGTQPLHPDLVMAKMRLGDVLLYQNRVNEAEPIFEETLAAMKKLYGPSSRRVAETLDGLSLIKRAQGQMNEAEEYAREALTVNAAAMGENHHTTGYFRTSYAAILLRRSKFKEAESQVRQSLESYERSLPPDHQYVASSEHLLGEILLATNSLDDAEAYLTAAMNRWKRIEAAPWRAARSESALGEVLYRKGRIKEAERYLVESYKTLAEDERADRDARVKSRERLQQFYTDRGQREKFEALMLATNQSPAGR
jgi:serine/threonine protein kinase/tetratricopeptide (TPR) repeat protein